MAHVTGEWNPLGEVFYRKIELYNMDHHWANMADLRKCKVAAAAYGGPLALCKMNTRASHTQPNAKSDIYIFSASGKPISVIKWDSGKLLDFDWSSSEDLVCIQCNGTILIYDLFATFQGHFSMGQESRDTGVIEGKVFLNYSASTTGVAVITGSYKIFVVNDVSNPQCRKMMDVPGLNSPPSSWAVICRERSTHILLAKDRQLFFFDRSELEHKNLEPSNPWNALIEMAVSFDHRYLALLTDTGDMLVYSPDLQRKITEFGTNSQMRPKQLVWCGNGAVVGYWENFLLVIGPKKDWIKYNIDTEAVLVPELDSLRIIQPYFHELLQRVPSAFEGIFKVASMESGAMLYEASKEFQKKSQKADEYIRMIKDDLPTAVDQCLNAAASEQEPSMQKTLLRAASFGRCFLTNSSPEKFENTCKILRVLNAARDAEVGMSLTYEQLKRLSLPVLIDRLIRRHQWELAVKISKYLDLPEADGRSRIYAHWACYKVLQKNASDEEIARSIRKNLGEAPGIPYAEIAKKASEAGRTNLAIRLLDYEPRASEQVPLLLTMEDTKSALMKAIESGDTDLVYMVLIQLQKTLPLQEFLMMLPSHPTAQSLYMQYCRKEKPELLLDLHYQNDNFLEMAHYHVADSYKQRTTEKRIESLRKSQENFTRARNDFAAKITEEQRKLLDQQSRIQEQLHDRFVGLSVHDTIHKLITKKETKLSEVLRKEFKIPDKRFWILKIDALAQTGDWMELEKFSKQRKPPVGFEHFVETCLKYGNNFEAKKYIPKVLPDKRTKMFILLGLYEEAADSAYQQKNESDLNQIMRLSSGDRALIDKIQKMKTALSGKR